MVSYTTFFVESVINMKKADYLILLRNCCCGPGTTLGMLATGDILQKAASRRNCPVLSRVLWRRGLPVYGVNRIPYYSSRVISVRRTSI